MKEIKLTRGQVALVDDGDFDWLNQWKWHARKKEGTWYVWRSYRVSRDKTVTIGMHRLIMNTPPNLQVDHIDHNGLNNQRANLRNCTASQNHMNRLPRGKSKYLGVSYYPKHENYVVHIKHNGSILYLGTFHSEEEAALVHDIAAFEYFGEFAYLNFPERKEEYRDKKIVITRTNLRGASSRYRGVSWYKAYRRWSAWMKYNKRRIHLGYFDNEEDAAIARDIGMVKHFGADILVNFPDKINEYLCLINQECEEGVPHV